MLKNCTGKTEMTNDGPLPIVLLGKHELDGTASAMTKLSFVPAYLVW